MNEDNQTPNPFPPMIPAAGRILDPQYSRLGEHPEDRRELGGLLGVIEAVLRHPRRVVFHLHQSGPERLIGALLALAIVCSLVYGVIVGSFSGGTQLWAAPVKIALGLLFSSFICLPSLYIFACLGGSQARLVEVLGLLAGLLALATLLLIGFAPVAWIFSQSTESVAGMGMLHVAFWIVSVGFGARFLQSGFRHLAIRSPAGINVWILIFLLVVMQMTTALRPLVGKADTLLPKEKKFFLVHWVDCMDGAKETRGAAKPE